jgi:hypothetical protein
MYRRMGVRCAGIVDFDALNNRTELDKQLQSLRLSGNEATDIHRVREAIAATVGETEPDVRLERARLKLLEMVADVRAMQERQFTSAEDPAALKETLLSSLERRLRALAASTNSWSELKKEGRKALPANLQQDFDRISSICSKQGFFINPCGELESTLRDVGIEWSSDKRAWISSALQLLANLEVDDEKYPWKLMKEIHDFFAPNERSKIEAEHANTGDGAPRSASDERSAIDAPSWEAQ